MHELSLATSLVELIEEESVHQNFRRVRKVRLEIGALAEVEPEALRFGFEVATASTCAAGALLEILTPPGEAWCLECGQSVVIVQYYDGCPQCQSHRLQVTGGRQFRLTELEVE